MISPEIIAFLGIFLGVLFRTLAPLIRKWREAQEKGQTFKFEQKYMATAVISILIAFVTSMIAIGSFKIPEGSEFYIFQNAFLYGLGLNSLINEVAEWLT